MSNRVTPKTTLFPRRLSGVTLFLVACAGPTQQPAPSRVVPVASARTTSAPPTATSPSSEPSVTTTSSLPDGEPCGSLTCLAFDSAEAALHHLIETTSVLVLAVGEIHVQKGIRLRETPPQRFSKLLPVFRGQARHLIIELWTGRNDCGDDRVRRVQEAQKPALATQASTNQNDYLELGNQAKALGIFPQALVPSCDDYQAIIAAKSDDISKMLELTAVTTRNLVESLLPKTEEVTRSPYVITYGGALHNDIPPRPGREGWSFGPELSRVTHGRFVELDLVLREQVRDTEPYTKMPWYPYYQQDSFKNRYVLYQTEKNSFTLIFPAE